MKSVLAAAIFFSASTTSLSPGDVCRIRLRTDDDEVVVQDVEALHALALGHKLIFCGPVMNEDNVGVSPQSDVECLAGADGDDLHSDSLGFRELRQQVGEQARLLRRRGRRDCNGTLLGLGGAEPAQDYEDDGDVSHRYVSICIRNLLQFAIDRLRRDQRGVNGSTMATGS
jgi:hypothetical protein